MVPACPPWLNPALRVQEVQIPVVTGLSNFVSLLLRVTTSKIPNVSGPCNTCNGCNGFLERRGDACFRPARVSKRSDGKRNPILHGRAVNSEKLLWCRWGSVAQAMLLVALHLASKQKKRFSKSEMRPLYLCL